MSRCAAIALFLAALPAHAQLITHRDLSYAMALTMASGALDACKARGYPVSVVVVDRGGDTMVALKADGAGPHTMENARRKAYTARTFGRSSAEWAKRTTEMPELAAQRELADVIALRGGVPIKVGNELIGAIGVAGAPRGIQDEQCAMTAIEKSRDKLKLAEPHA